MKDNLCKLPVNPDEESYSAEAAKAANIIGKKIVQARKARKLTSMDLSRELVRYGVDVGRGAVNKWEIGMSIPNGYQMMALCRLFGIDDSVSYFTGRPKLNDEGLLKLAAYRDDLIATGLYKPKKEEIFEYDVTEMPVALMPASAGPGNFLDEENFETVTVSKSSVPHGADIGIRVTGDSMEPVYTAGQIVWVKLCEELRPGEVGIFLLDGAAYIKVFSDKEPDEPESAAEGSREIRRQPVLISYNPAYSPIEVPYGAEFRIVGKVLS